MTIKKTQEQIIDEFKLFGGEMEKYNYLIKIGRGLPVIDSQYKTENNLIKGCQVKTWYYSDFKDGKIFYAIDSVSLVIRGFIALLIRIFSGQRPADVQKADLFFIKEIRLEENFSPLRANSLFKLTDRIKTDAAFYLSKQNNG